MKPNEHPQILSNEMLTTAENNLNISHEIDAESKETEIATAKEEFDTYVKKLCVAEDDPEVILDRLHEAKNDAFHVGKYKLMAMLGDEIEKRETMDDKEDLEEAVA